MNEEPDLWLHREAAKKLNALYSNRIFVQPLPEGLVRLNFGEVLDEDEPTYHSCVILTAENALQFADLIRNVAAGLLPPPIVKTNSATTESRDRG